MKKIEDYTADELVKKIQAIKTERERTADALKRYEEELERRRQEMPLGVSFVPKTGEDYWWVDIGGNPIHSFFEGGHVDFQVLSECGCFKSYASAAKHAKMLKEWRRDGLAANARGELIDIKVLCPLLKKGKVLYSPYDEKWKWIEQDAIVCEEEHGWYIKKSQVLPIEGFNIKPAEDWRNSLMECGL